jgi:hypothetical protein
VGYEVYDQDGERIGRPDDLFVDENDNPEYVGVRTNPLTTRSALIPADVITVDDSLSRMVLSRPKSVVEAEPGARRGADDRARGAGARPLRAHEPSEHQGQGRLRRLLSRRGVSAEARTRTRRFRARRRSSPRQTGSRRHARPRGSTRVRHPGG